MCRRTEERLCINNYQMVRENWWWTWGHSFTIEIALLLIDYINMEIALALDVGYIRGVVLENRIHE